MKEEEIAFNARKGKYWLPFSKKEIDEWILDYAKCDVEQLRIKQNRWPISLRQLEEETRELARRHHDKYAKAAVHDLRGFRELRRLPQEQFEALMAAAMAVDE